jgi:glycosyltransferase involved in cell wall biosynthesis
MFRRVSGQGAQNLLVIAYAFDPKSMVFSHQYQIICKLAEKFRQVYVIANDVNFRALKPENVKLFDLKWTSSSTFRNFRTLYKFTLPILFRNRNVVLFSFMTETHSMVLAPVTRMLGIKHILWYAHVSSPIRVKVAARLIDRILTSTTESIPANLKKRALAIGQMVDSNLFEFYGQRNYSKKSRWIHVGRIDPSKEIETLIIFFIGQLNINPYSVFLIVGEATEGNKDYEREIRARFAAEIEAGRIVFKGRQTHDQIKLLLNQSDLFIHCFRGSLDKSLVEATMSGITVITRNDAYLSVFGGLNEELKLELGTQAFIQYEINRWKSASSKDLELLAKKRADIALSNHSLNRWVEKLTAELKR